MLEWICMAINIGILAYGGYVDYKRREIPNAVPIVLLLTGLLIGWQTLPLRLLSLFLMAGVFLLSAKLTGNTVPGGDFKLLSALAFSSGLMCVGVSMVLTAAGSALVGLLTKKKVSRHIPLCTYVAPAYVIACFIIYII